MSSCPRPIRHCRFYSVDYPFVGNDGAVEFLRRADLPEAVKEDIAHRNAERLLGGNVLAAAHL